MAYNSKFTGTEIDAAISGINATAEYVDSVVKIKAPDGVSKITFITPSDFNSSDTYTLNDNGITITDLNNEPIEDAWKANVTVTLTLNGNRAFFKVGGVGINETLPAQVTNFKAVQVSGAQRVTVSWTKPSSYFSGILIVRKTGSAPTGVKDGTQAYKGTGSSFVDSSVNYGTTYYYRAFPYNSKGQYQTEYLVVSVNPINSIRLDSLTEGALIKLNENGIPVLFYSAKRNYESGLNGTGRCLMVRKDAYDTIDWDYSYENAWGPCDLRNWLNETYKNMLDSNIRNLIGTTKYYYTIGYGNWTVNTISDAVFSLSLTEYGLNNTNANVEGSALPIYNTLRNAYNNGKIVHHWTRTPYKADREMAYRIAENGDYGQIVCRPGKYTGGESTIYSRPVFTLPGNLMLKGGQNSDGSYSIL